jgi:hypothetical protein
LIDLARMSPYIIRTRTQGGDRWRCQDSDNGAVAQLGERYNGIVEVRGSIPLGSTITTLGHHPKDPKD